MVLTGSAGHLSTWSNTRPMFKQPGSGNEIAEGCNQEPLATKAVTNKWVPNEIIELCFSTWLLLTFLKKGSLFVGPIR